MIPESFSAYHALTTADRASLRMDDTVLTVQRMPARAIRQLPGTCYSDSGMRDDQGLQLFFTGSSSHPSLVCFCKRTASQVHSRRYCFQVQRILASSVQTLFSARTRVILIMTGMVDPEACRNQPGGKFPACNVRRRARAVPEKAPITGSADDSSRPRPAFMGSATIYASPVTHVIRGGLQRRQLCCTAKVLSVIMPLAQFEGHVVIGTLPVSYTACSVRGGSRGQRFRPAVSHVTAMTETPLDGFPVAAWFSTLIHGATVSEKQRKSNRSPEARSRSRGHQFNRKGDRI